MKEYMIHVWGGAWNPNANLCLSWEVDNEIQ